jgi:hypothetical protein
MHRTECARSWENQHIEHNPFDCLGAESHKGYMLVRKVDADFGYTVHTNPHPVLRSQHIAAEKEGPETLGSNKGQLPGELHQAAGSKFNPLLEMGCNKY